MGIDLRTAAYQIPAFVSFHAPILYLPSAPGSALPYSELTGPDAGSHKVLPHPPLHSDCLFQFH